MTRVTRVITVAIAFTALVGAGTGRAFAQDVKPGAGRVEVSFIPAGGVFFTEHTDTGEPSFGNYDLGGAVTFNFNRYVGVEGEVSGALGIAQDLQFGSVTAANRKTPDILNYSGNVVVSAPTHSSVVPYVTGGVGGLSLFEEASLGINGTETLLHRQRRRRRQVVRRPLGVARRLPVHRRAVEGRCAGVLREGRPVRPPDLRSRSSECRPVISTK